MNYTRQANEVLRIAERTAKEMNHPYIGTEHLLIGLQSRSIPVWPGRSWTPMVWTRRTDPDGDGGTGLPRWE